MRISMKNDEEDFYSLVQCNCGRKFKPEELYICYACKKIKCQYCLRTEGQLFQCKAGCTNQFTAGTKTKYVKFCCSKCLECPICFAPLTKKESNGKHYLLCPSCYWNSIKVHVAKGKVEELDSYIQRMNEEANNGFLKKMYSAILEQLSSDPLIENKSKKLDLEERVNEDSYNDIVKKAMEEGGQKLEIFEEKKKLELANNEKKATGKCEYNDDYLNSEDNKYITFKIINKLLPCYTDYTQTFNTLEEVQKAFNSNDLSLNNMIGLEQRHNNPILQNNTVLNQYPRFSDLIPKKHLFGKKCKECGKLVVEEVDDNQKDSRIVHSFVSQLPLAYINKIDLEQNLIRIRYILLNFIGVTISFKEDPSNQVKIILPEGKFNFDEKEGEAIKGTKYKNILVDFKFDESYKSELTSQSYHVMRFIVRVEFNRSESDNQNDGESAIEYPSEIKFKIK